LWLLDELDTPLLQLLVRGLDVVGRQKERSGEPLCHQVAYLLRRLRVHNRRTGDRHQRNRDVRLSLWTDGQPAEVSHLGDGLVTTYLPAQLARVEREVTGP
jgi:hypothetical protein